MNNNIKFSSIVILLLLALTANVFAGGGKRTGTNGAPELLIPVGTRDIAMGGASIATTSGVEAIFWNPAGLAKTQTSADLYFSHMSYIADIGVDYGAAAVSFGDLGNFAITLKSLSMGDIEVTTNDSPDGTGQTFSPQYFTTGLTYSKRLSDRISVGLTANLIIERIAEVSANGVGFNVGVMYDNFGSINGLGLGVVVKNVGPQMDFSGPGLNISANASDQLRGSSYYTIDAAAFELPSTIEFGLSYKKPLDDASSILFAGTFQSNNFSSDEYKVGGEYSYRDNFFIRGGWNLAADKTDDPASYIYGPTVGTGVHYSAEGFDITVDYAFRHTEYFAGNHVIGIRLGF